MGRDNRESGNGGFALFCCFIALGVSAVIAFINYLLPQISDVSLGDNVMEILGIVFNVSTLVGLGAGALAFAKRRGLLIKILTAVFVLVFVVAIVLRICGVV